MAVSFGLGNYKFARVFAPMGGGICFLFFLILLTFGVICWLSYWWRCGFRASPARTHVGQTTRYLFMVAVFALSIAFPPMRRAADWTEQATGIPVPSSDALTFDRFYFGYIPSYHWIGHWGDADRESKVTRHTND